MSLYIGNQKLGSLYLGSTKIKEAWVGDVKVYGSSDPFTPVIIGSQTWMSKNLAIDDGQGGIVTQTVNYGHGNITEYYYTRAAAVRLAATVPGWHLPTLEEWNTLINTVGGASIAGTKLKSTYGWKNDGNGTDDYGFTALPAGCWNEIQFLDLNNFCDFWTATNRAGFTAWPYYLSFGYYDSQVRTFDGQRVWGRSVRLVKD